MASPRKVKQRKRKTLEDEIADTEKRGQHEVLGLSISITRGLFLHALRAMRDGDYGSVSAYVSDLIRRDKHIHNSKPLHDALIRAYNDAGNVIKTHEHKGDFKE